MVEFFYALTIAFVVKYEKTKVALTLFTELSRGKKSGEEPGWIPKKDISEHFASRFKNA